MTTRKVPIAHYVISAFPGTGKTTVAKTRSTGVYRIVDLESSQWSHDSTGSINPEFPKNYVDAIEKTLRKNTFVLVSSHEKVRMELDKRRIRFVYVVPGINDKTMYLKRYKARGNTPAFIENVRRNWEKWLSPNAYKGTDVVLTLEPYQHITDIIYRIKHDERLRSQIAGA